MSGRREKINSVCIKVVTMPKARSCRLQMLNFSSTDLKSATLSTIKYMTFFYKFHLKNALHIIYSSPDLNIMHNVRFKRVKICNENKNKKKIIKK